MKRITSLRTTALCFLVWLLPGASMYSQTVRMSGVLVLRSQAGSLAEEALGKLASSFKDIDQIQLIVEGGGSRALVENAFLESLNRQGIHTSLRMDLRRNRSLQVTVLEQGVQYVGLSSGDYRREVRTSIEARDIVGDSSSARYLGVFSRSDIDTVAFREDIGMVPAGREGERTLFDKLVGPIVLIGGAFLIVYLFFTVRN